MIKIKPSNRSVKANSELLNYYLKKDGLKSTSKNKLVNLSTLDANMFNKLPNKKMLDKIFEKAEDPTNHHYGLSVGDTETRKVWAKFLSTDKIKFNENDLILSYGALASFNNLIFSTVNPKESIIIGKPYYSQSQMATSFLDIDIIFYDYNSIQEKIDFDFIRKEILKREKTPKFIFIVDPINPTNKQMKKDQIENFFKLCKEFNMFIVLDNIFFKNLFVEDNFDIYIDNHYKYKVPIILIASITKCFNFCGSRFGYTLKIDSDNYLKNIWDNGLKKFVQIPLSINTYIQKGIKEFFIENPDGDKKYLEDNTNFYKSNSEFIMNELKDHKILKPIKNDSSYFIYILVDLSKLRFKSMSEFTLKLLEEKNIMIFPSEVFYGKENFIRMTIGEEKDVLKYSLEQLNIFIQENLNDK